MILLKNCDKKHLAANMFILFFSYLCNQNLIYEKS